MIEIIQGSHGKPRLLVINNMPAYYRTPLFQAIVDEWERQTGGSAEVGYQVRRDSHARSEWFFSPDDELKYPHFFVSPDTVPRKHVTGYPLRTSIRRFALTRPTHIFVAGWDSPLSVQAAAWARISGARMAAWVESNPSTSKLKGGLGDVYRRTFLRSASLAVVPTRSSRDHVQQLSGRPLPTLMIPNPVSVPRIPPTQLHGRRIVFLGDLSHRKGFDIFVDAAQILQERGWSAVAWGRDPEGRAAQAGSVEVRQSQPLEKIIPQLRSNDVLMITSRWDPAPLTFSEGIALGLRLILSDSVAYADGLESVQGVRVARSEDPRAFADQALALMHEDRPSPEQSTEVRPAWFAGKLVGSLVGNAVTSA